MKIEAAKAGKPGWIIAFLGNPGIKYSGTRHNAGFMAGDALGKMLGVRITRAAFRALTAKTEINGEKVLLLKPQTYMNLSGESVAKAARYYKVPAEHIIVLSDEMHLALGSIMTALKNADAELLGAASARAAEAAVSYITEGAEKTMNKYNGGSQ